MCLSSTTPVSQKGSSMALTETQIEKLRLGGGSLTPYPFTNYLYPLPIMCRVGCWVCCRVCCRVGCWVGQKHRTTPHLESVPFHGPTQAVKAADCGRLFKSVQESSGRPIIISLEVM